MGPDGPERGTGGLQGRHAVLRALRTLLLLSMPTQPQKSLQVPRFPQPKKGRREETLLFLKMWRKLSVFVPRQYAGNPKD